MHSLPLLAIYLAHLVVDLATVRLAANGDPLVEAHQLAHPTVKGLYLDNIKQTEQHEQEQD